MALNNFNMAMRKHLEKMMSLLEPFNNIFKILSNKNNYTLGSL